MDNNEINIFPVAAWTVRTVQAYDIILFQPDFLTHAMQSHLDPTPGRTYALTTAQATELVAQIQRALHALQSADPTPPPDQPH